MPEDTIDTLFTLSIEAEMAAREFYEGLLRLFGHNPRAARVWEEMRSDEEEHARFLEEVRARLTPEQLQEPADPEMMRGLRNALMKFSPQGMLQSIRDLNDAYNYAHELENSEINSVLEFIIHEYHIDPVLRARLVEMYLQAHVKRLLVLGGTAWRRSIQAQK
jgi:alkylation response protein AidB-like acyl-CoA dehydrogenase